MTRVDFYILPDEEASARHEFACRLIQKTCRLGHKVYIHCQDEEHAHALDGLLWSFQPDSFLPHKIIHSAGADCPIEIGYEQDAGDHHDVMINLGNDIPAFFSRFNRVAEIVVQSEPVLGQTRKRYRHYQQRHYPLHRHDMR